MSQSTFALRGRNPDVLTCIANLSNDEVFTPPDFANQMLDTLATNWAASHDGANIWADKSVTFLDPSTKSGVFLREITRRLISGLEKEIPDLEERVGHILKKQVFGIGITRITSLLARRSVYCSKHATGKHSVVKSFANDEGNIWFKRTEHTWENDRCKYCSAVKVIFNRGAELETHAYALIHSDNVKAWVNKIFGGNMQFDVIIGNPPYQIDDGGHGASAAPIYHLFVEQAMKLDPQYLSLVIPARWFAGGKGLDEFRHKMLSDNRIRAIHDYLLVGEAFPGVAIQGGILYFLWDRDHPGECQVNTHYQGQVMSSATRPLLEPGSDIFVRFNEAVSILKKIVAVEGGTSKSVSLPEAKRFMNLMSPRRPFGISSNHVIRSDHRTNDVIAYWNGGPGFKQGGKGWVARSEVTDGGELIDKWKVFIGRAYGDRGGGGASRDSFPKAVLGRPFLGEPGSVSTETYICAGPLASEAEAANIATYISCKLTRFLVMLHKPAQDATRKVYTFVPTQDFTKSWTDQELYKKYRLSQDEINFIESVIRPMDLETYSSDEVIIDQDE